VLSHRNDYGNNRLIVARELNSGISVTSIWFANAFKLLVVVTFKSFTASIVVYVFTSTLLDFGYVFLGYFLGTWCWALFAQVLSLFFTNQLVAMLTLILVPTFEVILPVPWQSGCNAGALMYPSPEALQGLCAREQPVYPPFWGGHFTVALNFWKIMYTAEMEEYPDYFAKSTLVNNTNYWMLGMDPSDLADPDYAGARGTAVLLLCLMVVSHHIAIWLLLRNMLNYVKNEKMSCHKFCGCSYQKVPEDVALRVGRQANQDSTSTTVSYA